jgi:maltooligosyltrehalose trehalohydrolase
VHFLQNHDQVGNTSIGDRVHTYVSPRRYRAATAVLLLGPQTPLLFMGQEFLASSRFMFFAEHTPELNVLVHKGRREFVGQFRAYATEAVQAAIRNPGEENTFLDSKLNWDEVEQHATAMALHKDLLRLRREDSVFANAADMPIDGATLSECAFVLRWFAPDEGDRLLVVNLDGELAVESCAEPLLAPPLHKTWRLVWASEDARYGGHGVIDPVSKDGRWCIPAECAVVLQAIDQTSQ